MCLTKQEEKLAAIHLYMQYIKANTVCMPWHLFGKYLKCILPVLL